MISFARVTSQHAKDYYYEKSLVDVPELQEVGTLTWIGSLSEELGLTGAVKREDWHNALDGLFPNGIEIPGGGTGEHRAGEDIVFDAPKSLSIAVLVSGDKRLLDIHAKAVRESLEFIESMIGTRNGKGGAEYEITGQMLAATTTHLVNRDNMPHIHTHSVVLNITKTQDGRYKSNDMSFAYKNQKAVRAFYNNVLAHELAKEGYSVHFDKYGVPQLKGFDRDHIMTYSTRAKQVEEFLDSKGLTRETASGETKQVGNYSTRKDKERLTQEHLDGYREFDKANNLDSDKALDASRIAPRDIELRGEHGRKKATELIEHVLKAETEREFVSSKEKVMARVLEMSKGRLSYNKIRETYDGMIESGEIVESPDDNKDKRYGIRITTKEALDIEKSLIKVMRDGKNSVRPIDDPEHVQSTIESKYGHLTDEQRRAFEHVLTTKDRFIHISGAAGVGKTTTLSPIVKELMKKGYEVVGLGPVWSAVMAMGEVDVKGGTIAGFLSKHHDQSRHVERIYMVDESGLASTRDMDKMQKIVASQGARMVYIGDAEQLQGVSAGAGLDVLIDNGLEVSEVTKMQRQRNAPDYVKEAAQASLTDPRKALDILAEHGALIVADKEAGEDLAGKVLETVREKGGFGPDTMVLASYHKTIAEITERAREELGLDQKPQVVIKSFEPDRSMSEADKRNIEILETKVGSSIQAGREYKRLGIEKGEVLELAGVDPVTGKLHLRGEDGREIYANHKNFTSYDVGDLKNISVAEGERIRVTGNQYFDRKNQYGEMRHSMGTVTNIDPEKNRITIRFDGEGGNRLELDLSKPQEITYGYGQTVDSVQGRSAKNVIVVDPSDMRRHYVANTRTKNELLHVTGDEDKLRESANRETNKTRASDVFEPRQLPEPKPKMEPKPKHKEREKEGLGAKLRE